MWIPQCLMEERVLHFMGWCLVFKSVPIFQFLFILKRAKNSIFNGIQMRREEVTPSYPHKAQVTHPLQDQTRVALHNTFAYLSGLFCFSVLSIDNKQRVDMEMNYCVQTDIMMLQKSWHGLLLMCFSSLLLSQFKTCLWNARCITFVLFCPKILYRLG